MDWELLLSVRNYWDRLRADRTVPCRSELDPKQFPAALENVFILERVSALDVRIRLCGAKINQVLDREGRGLAFEAIFDAKIGSLISGAPFLCWSVASRFKKPNSRFERPTPAMLVRSWPSKYLA